MARINPTDLNDRSFNEIMDMAEGRFEGFRNPVIWAAQKWGLDKYRSQFLQGEMRCWQALQAGEAPPKGTESWVVDRQTEILQMVEFSARERAQKASRR